MNKSVILTVGILGAVGAAAYFIIKQSHKTAPAAIATAQNPASSNNWLPGAISAGSSLGKDFFGWLNNPASNADSTNSTNQVF